MRKDIEFKTQDGVTLAAWHYLPDQNSGEGETATLRLDRWQVAAQLSIVLFSPRSACVSRTRLPSS